MKVRANCRQGARAAPCRHRQVRRTRVEMLEDCVHWLGYIGASTHTCPWAPGRGLGTYSEGLRYGQCRDFTGSKSVSEAWTVRAVPAALMSVVFGAGWKTAVLADEHFNTWFVSVSWSAFSTSNPFCCWQVENVKITYEAVIYVWGEVGTFLTGIGTAEIFPSGRLDGVVWAYLFDLFPLQKLAKLAMPWGPGMSW